MSPEGLAALSSQYLTALYSCSPTTAASLGLHQYDGKIGDPSDSARRARIAELRSFRARLEALDPEGLDRAEGFDYDLLRQDIEAQLFALEELRAHEWDPMSYLWPTDVSLYTKRSYAPLENRVRAMTSHLLAIPEYLDEAWTNLREPLPRVPLTTAIDAFVGQAEYLRKDLVASIPHLPDEQLRTDLSTAIAKAAQAVESFTAKLRTRLETADDRFAIGHDCFQRMLSTNELVDIPIERLLAIGEADLRKNQEALREAAAVIDPNASIPAVMSALGKKHPAAERVVPETAEMLEELRSFIIERDVVTVPSEVRCKVEETPSFMRFAFAFMDPPGPFETTASEAYYYLTPVEEGWSPEEKEEWLSLFSYHILRDVSIHETYPGHYLHFLHLQRIRSDVAKVLQSYAFIEGWAHYCEQMMVEVGYASDDPELLIAQLTEALLRDCRYITAIKMHTQGMSVEEATRFFMENAYMEELPARKEAERGTYDPGYLNYTLGKLLILRLRDDYRRETGEAFSLKRFHDELLALGAPPVPLARKYMLTSSNGALL